MDFSSCFRESTHCIDHHLRLKPTDHLTRETTEGGTEEGMMELF